jgi:hypothetical protein
MAEAPEMQEQFPGKVGMRGNICAASPPPIETGSRTGSRGPFLVRTRKGPKGNRPGGCRAYQELNERHSIPDAFPPCSRPRGRAHGASLHRSRGRGLSGFASCFAEKSRAYIPVGPLEAMLRAPRPVLLRRLFPAGAARVGVIHGVAKSASEPRRFQQLRHAT